MKVKNKIILQNIFFWVFIAFLIYGSLSGIYSFFETKKLQKEIKLLQIEMIKKELNVTCTWDIPAQLIGADLPPLPVRKP